VGSRSVVYTCYFGNPFADSRNNLDLEKHFVATERLHDRHSSGSDAHPQTLYTVSYTTKSDWKLRALCGNDLSHKIRVIWVGTGNPRQSAALVSLMVPCHSPLKPDPYSATPFMSSILCFILSSKDEMCYINVSPEVLGRSFLFYKFFADLHIIICTYHCLKYFKMSILKIWNQDTVAPMIPIISSLRK
jgi:hypothetical protein